MNERSRKFVVPWMLAHLGLRNALGQRQHFQTDHAILAVEVNDHTGCDLLGIDDLRFVESQVQRISVTIEVHSHSFLNIARSKYNVTTRIGRAVLFTTTRNTRPPCSEIRPKRCSSSASSESGSTRSGEFRTCSHQAMSILRSFRTVFACLVRTELQQSPLNARRRRGDDKILEACERSDR